MEWVQPDEGDITEHGSTGVFMVELARFEQVGTSRTYITQIAPGGVLGRHTGRADLVQLMYVVTGTGWVSGADEARHEIKRGQAVLWSAGESHESGSDTGMTVVMVIADKRPPTLRGTRRNGRS